MPSARSQLRFSISPYQHVCTHTTSKIVWLYLSQVVSIETAVPLRSPKLGNLARFMAQTCKVETIYKITNDCNSKHPWYPEVCVVNDIPFVQISRFNRDLTRFVTGKALDLRKDKGHTIGGAFIDKIMELRNKASHNAFAEVTQNPEEAECHPRKRPRKAKKSDSLLAPAWVSIVFPSTAQFEEGEVKCLWGVGRNPLWIEMQSGVLDHLKDGIKELGSIKKTTTSTPMKGRKRNGEQMI